MAAREYVYARRVWPRASDGGCYSVSRACGHAAAPPPRGVPVLDFAAAMLIRNARSCRGSMQGVLLGLMLLLADLCSTRVHRALCGRPSGRLHPCW